MSTDQFISPDQLKAALNPADKFFHEFDNEETYNFILSIRPEDADPEQMRAYGMEAFKRILYTVGLIPDQKRVKVLEIGSNPYKLTMFLRLFYEYQLTLTNYFGEPFNDISCQKVIYRDILDGTDKTVSLRFHNLNIEITPFPFPDDTYDIVLLNEVLEHLVASPLFALLEIKRVLKKDGFFILTTPNACRLENIFKMISGMNIYEPYSPNGLYGRHNREYNRHELFELLLYSGFKIDESFTADVRENQAVPGIDWSHIAPMIERNENRYLDLGQYIFMRLINTKADPSGPPPSVIAALEKIANEK